MNDIFSDLLNVCIVFYLKNILIYLDNMFQHKNYIKEVLLWLQKTELYAKAEKCKFHSNFVEYSGYILSLFGLSISSDKINTI